MSALFARSDQYLEFGLANPDGQMNCFLNSALQLFWSLVLTGERENFIKFVFTPIESGPVLLQPLIGAMCELFKEAGRIQPTVPVLKSVKIRRELFKLFYLRQSFDLNKKADAFEAFDFLLTSIHSWISHCQNPRSTSQTIAQEPMAARLAHLSKNPCYKSDWCCVHTGFHLAKYVWRECTFCCK